MGSSLKWPHVIILSQVYICQSEMSFHNQTLLSSLGEVEGNKSHEGADNEHFLFTKQVVIVVESTRNPLRYSFILYELGILYFLVVGWQEFPRNKAPFPSDCSLQGYQVCRIIRIPYANINAYKG